MRAFAQTDDLLRLIDILNPENEAGRLTLDRPLRRRESRRQLPALVRAVKREGRVVLWSCDPMHGNTITSASGYKTRPFDLILKEVRASSRSTRRKAPMPAACISR